MSRPVRTRWAGGLAVLACAGLALVGCGDDDSSSAGSVTSLEPSSSAPASTAPVSTAPSTSAPASSAPATTAPASFPIGALVAALGIDPTAAQEALCSNWEMGHPDHWIVNSYVWDLLAPLELVNGPNPPAFDTPDIDSAVEQACGDHAADPAGFAQAVASDLGLTLADVVERAGLACARYRVEQQRIAAGDWSGSDVDPQIIGIAESAGVSEPQLRQAIETICGAVSAPTTTTTGGK